MNHIYFIQFSCILYLYLQIQLINWTKSSDNILYIKYYFIILLLYYIQLIVLYIQIFIKIKFFMINEFLYKISLFWYENFCDWLYVKLYVMYFKLLNLFIARYEYEDYVCDFFKRNIYRRI